ncbi:hypothetical protein KCX82_10455 [Clostridiales bacterium BAD-6]|uniref:WD40-like Beta Propeller Repeat n=2 Tax=Sinanaerobacter chloroacetimidivorans TaxID=2818044 RepID=A0A8J7W0T2_9FIRM|nr:hypothetical protein [Sinanaerobacter chloroacetimidivorans]
MSLCKFAGKAQYQIFCCLLAVAFMILITGCTFDPVSKNPEEAMAESRLVYAASDGLYLTNLTGETPNKVLDDRGLSYPVFSEKGDRIIFRKTVRENNSDTYIDRVTIFVYDIASGQNIMLGEEVLSYCAGPENSFLISTKDGKLLQADLHVTSSEGKELLEYETRDLSLWPEAVSQNPDIAITYENLKASPDKKYLAYNVNVQDNRIEDGREGGYYYSGGMYVLNLPSEEAVLVVKPIRSTPESLGNNPEPGPWSRDGTILTVWDKPQSGSLSADGVNCLFYHVDTKKTTTFDSSLLAYDENISFSRKNNIAALTGYGRDMFADKRIDEITDVSGSSAVFHTLQEIYRKGLVPAMPQFSADGKTLYFAAMKKTDLKGLDEGQWMSEDYQNVYPLKRQLYAMALNGSREIREITSDPQYRCESPILLNNEKYLVFGRANAEDYDGSMSIWMVSADGKDERLLGEWQEEEYNDVWMSDKYDDYYGRGSWHGIFAIYDATK